MDNSNPEVACLSYLGCQESLKYAMLSMRGMSVIITQRLAMHSKMAVELYSSFGSILQRHSIIKDILDAGTMIGIS